MISTNPPAARPLLLGHRGARKYAAENTLEAFDLALDHGCDGFEFDVRCTADKRLIIWHDATLKRRRLDRAAYRELCERLNTRWRSKKAAPSIPCLEQIVAAYADRAYLNIEVKVPGIEAEIAQAVIAEPISRGYLVSSFQPDVVDNLRGISPRLTVGWIVSDRRLLSRWTKLDFDVLVAHRTLVSPRLVEAVHQAGRKLFVWTVNRPKAMLTLADWGVDAIISDDTRLVSRTLRGRH